jgi:hypothetical protein
MTTTGEQSHVLRITSLQRALEQIDGATKSEDPTEIVLAAAKAAKMVEHGWRVGKVILVGRLPISDELEIIKPPNSLKPALNRFGGHDWRTPEIRISRNGRYEVWTDISIDDAGVTWLGSVCCLDLKRLIRKGSTEANIAYEAEHDIETECRDWLIELMEQGSPERNRVYYEDTAKERFGITVRGFRRAWDAAIELTGNTDWRKSGPKVRGGPRAKKIIRDTKK